MSCELKKKLLTEKEKNLSGFFCKQLPSQGFHLFFLTSLTFEKKSKMAAFRKHSFADLSSSENPSTNDIEPEKEKRWRRASLVATPWVRFPQSFLFSSLLLHIYLFFSLDE